MIEDLFSKRYKDIRYPLGMPEGVDRFLVQAGMLFQRAASFVDFGCDDYERVLSQLDLEFGGLPFTRRMAAARTIHDGLAERYKSREIGDGDAFFRVRMSVIELLFREGERKLALNRAKLDALPEAERPTKPGTKLGKPAERALSDRETGFSSVLDELNQRMREGGLLFHYHNGLIQAADDPVSQDQIASPFWPLIGKPVWRSVDDDMKRAKDLLDTGKPDVAFYAARALESVIKIISDQKGWSNGKEKGASNYIDNLVSHKSGRFVDVWEADMLKAFFKDVRNPHSHGSGSTTPPAFTRQQSVWAIDVCMSWIKSLVKRM